MDEGSVSKGMDVFLEEGGVWFARISVYDVRMGMQCDMRYSSKGRQGPDCMGLLKLV